jgi:hypothetical protein
MYIWYSNIHRHDMSTYIITICIFVYVHVYDMILIYDIYYSLPIYSDVSRNYLNGTIPEEWGSMNLVNMYDFFVILFYNYFLLFILIIM